MTGATIGRSGGRNGAIRPMCRCRPMSRSPMPPPGRSPPLLVRELAQTNLQLYEQLISRGWTARDLAAVRDAYELSAQLFSGRYRASGKTFVAHVVGTASCVAAIGGTPPMVSAALLHAAYEHGDFGPDQDRAHGRARLVDEVGPEVEALVAEYTATPLNVATIEDLQRRAADLPSLTRDVVLIRTANEVDDHVDRGTDIAARV